MIEGKVSEGHVMVRKVMITPSRIRILQSGQVKSNRLVRKYSDKYVFAHVHFCDEQFQPFYDKNTFSGRFKAIICKGFDLCGMHFQFVACSNSQMRERTCTFVSGDCGDVKRIRDSLVDNSLLEKGVVKYLSRLGLFCTADEATPYEVDLRRVQFIEDRCTTGSNSQVMTDSLTHFPNSLAALLTYLPTH